MERKISDLYNMLPFELTTGQKNFLSLATAGENVFCQGSGGAGKSTVLEILKEYWGDKALFTATTGVANMRLFDNQGGAGTTARMMGLPRGIAQPKHWREFTRASQEALAASDRIEVVIVEECGCLNSEQLSLMQHRINKVNKANKKRRQRDIKLILVGDILQLGGVSSEEEKQFYSQKYGSHLFFKSDVFKGMNFKTVYLDEVKRQNDKVYLAALDVLRYGNTDRIHKLLPWLNKRYSKKVPENVPRICATNKAVDQFNYNALQRNPNELFCYTPDIEGDFNYEDNCPVPYELDVKVGMVAMTLINQEDGLFQNGSTGVVTDCNASGIWLKLNSTGEEILVEPYEFIEMHDVEVSRTTRADGTDHVEYESQEKGKCFHVPLCHAAGISIHKAQGQTISSEYVIDMGSTWAYENRDWGHALSYVAFSRATCYNNVHLKVAIKPSHIKVCEETITWLYSVDAIDASKVSKRMLAKCKEYKESINE